jgi:hypothetical protein
MLDVIEEITRFDPTSCAQAWLVGRSAAGAIA